MKTLCSAALVILSLLLSVSLEAQNITNILGTNGIFTIKNSSTEYFKLTQSTGRINIFNTLRLEATTGATVGVIYSNNDRLLHNFGLGNTYLGLNAGNYNNTLFNTSFGELTLYSNTLGSENTAVGYLTLGFNTSGIRNSAFGYISIFFNTTAGHNTAFGTTSLVSNLSGEFNSAFGDSSIALNNSGDSNSAFGSQSLVANTTGSQNSAFGRQSLLRNTTGSFNTAVGYISGSNITTGSNLTSIGYNSQPTTGTANNQFTLGNSSITSLRCNVTSITSLSDARDKKNIKDLSLGLNFLMKLQPRQYNWDKREWYESGIPDGTKMETQPTAGFIAQELDSAQNESGAGWLNLVLKDNPEKWEASAGNLLPVIIKAIQELKTENEKLNTENSALTAENKELEKLLSEMENLQKVLEDEYRKNDSRKNNSEKNN
jgi:hypothetical protein